MTFIDRLREIVGTFRDARFPESSKKNVGAGGYTGEGPLLRALLRDAERNRKRHDDAMRRRGRT